MIQKVKVETKDREPVAKEECSHYWIIEVANGPKSRGVCRYCGEEKEFQNTMPDYAAIKRNTRPIGLPGLPDVELDKGSDS